MERLKDLYLRDVRRTTVYEKAIQLVVEVKEFTETLPWEEKDVIKNQIWKSITSVSANLSEGNGQMYYKKELQFLNIALGSAAETQTWFEISYRCGYIDEKTFENFDERLIEIRRMIIGMMKKIVQK
ncbi:four helix bundle protein [Fredinandcohnia quinoae]|uniref:Four helix bundle protein n=1 Tax=Fredinandcohnia quinoae TaxID=2918902 RepID=A0AAW5EC20_9BACI|nr:four helix bundle protein [Fredinandcohnia sp. SECRCQ15]MCH1627220.1 four helix bundle protein [Fredinandcohnia sp. SECRCQ15]